MKTILAPVDFSAVTNRVADAAINLARLLKGRVVLVHVVPPPAAIRNVLPAVEDVEQRATSIGHEADIKLFDQKKVLQRKFRAVETMRLSGAPVACILEKAKELAAEFIVMGSHGHSAVFDALMGSVASGVVRKAPCPVVLVPPAAAAAEPIPQATPAHATA